MLYSRKWLKKLFLSVRVWSKNMHMSDHILFTAGYVWTHSLSLSLSLSLSHTHTHLGYQSLGPRPPSVHNVLRLSQAHHVPPERTDEEEDIKWLYLTSRTQWRWLMEDKVGTAGRRMGGGVRWGSLSRAGAPSPSAVFTHWCSRQDSHWHSDGWVPIRRAEPEVSGAGI